MTRDTFKAKGNNVLTTIYIETTPYGTYCVSLEWNNDQTDLDCFGEYESEKVAMRVADEKLETESAKVAILFDGDCIN